MAVHVMDRAEKERLGVRIVEIRDELARLVKDARHIASVRKQLEKELAEVREKLSSLKRPE
jgi:septal ring factor EnvC (AmiA/AmiB activator)